MSQYLDGHRVLKKKNGFSGETPGTNISQASLGCQPHSPEQKSAITSAHSALPAYPPRPRPLAVLPFETALITHYLNFMLIDPSLQPDSESSICDETTCTRYFTYFTRRHHCRRCGNIFCDLHSLYTIPLDQDANYHPKGTRVRSCEHCWTDYRRWQIARSSRSNSESSHSEEPATPTVSCGKPRGAMSNVFGKAGGLSESIAASVPRDWNWSTF